MRHCCYSSLLPLHLGGFTESTRFLPRRISDSLQRLSRLSNWSWRIWPSVSYTVPRVCKGKPDLYKPANDLFTGNCVPIPFSEHSCSTNVRCFLDVCGVPASWRVGKPHFWPA